MFLSTPFTIILQALQDEEWVLWIDSDLWSYPPDVIQRLIAPRKDIVIPNCVMGPGQRSYDLNSWKRPQPPRQYEILFPAMDVSAKALESMTTLQLVQACASQLRLTEGLPSSRSPAFPGAKELEAVAGRLQEELLGKPAALGTMTTEDWKAVQAKVIMPAGLATCL